MTGPIALIGLGALGGSLARSLRTLDPAPEVVGFDAQHDRVAAARGAGVIDREADDVSRAAEGARIVVVAVPLGAEESVLSGVAETLRADALVMDVGSLQAPALAAAAGAGLAARFVACHPMAGTEASGFGAAAADLYRDRRVWLSALEAGEGRLDEARAFWTELGARAEMTDAETHDTLMAVVSHLPQVTANALARVIEAGGFQPGDLGPGGLDMTRLAGSNAVLWRDILEHSGSQVAALLRLLARELDGWARMLDGQDLDALAEAMEQTRLWRNP